jgi:F-type H+-transporting ATPase subunit epsilon
MKKRFHLEVITPSEFSIHQDVESIIAPGSEGYFGVLPGHTYFITSLKEGYLSIKIGDDYKKFNIGKGYLEVTEEETIILTEYIKSEEMTQEEISEWGLKYKEHE